MRFYPFCRRSATFSVSACQTLRTLISAKLNEDQIREKLPLTRRACAPSHWLRPQQPAGYDGAADQSGDYLPIRCARRAEPERLQLDRGPGEPAGADHPRGLRPGRLPALFAAGDHRRPLRQPEPVCDEVRPVPERQHVLRQQRPVPDALHPAGGYLDNAAQPGAHWYPVPAELRLHAARLCRPGAELVRLQRHGLVSRHGLLRRLLGLQPVQHLRPDGRPAFPDRRLALLRLELLPFLLHGPSRLLLDAGGQPDGLQPGGPDLVQPQLLRAQHVRRRFRARSGAAPSAARERPSAVGPPVPSAADARRSAAAPTGHRAHRVPSVAAPPASAARSAAGGVPSPSAVARPATVPSGRRSFGGGFSGRPTFGGGSYGSPRPSSGGSFGGGVRRRLVRRAARLPSAGAGGGAND